MDKNDVMLVGWRANTDDPTRGRTAPFARSASGRFLDKVAPGWEDYRAANLDWTHDDDADLGQRVTNVWRRKPAPKVVVLFGHEVARAFDLKPRLFTWASERGAIVVVLPHPSGRNRVWNDKENVKKAMRFFEALEIADGPTKLEAWLRRNFDEADAAKAVAAR